jgi:hypothetical protein
VRRLRTHLKQMYLLRIELHDADDGDYDKLHEEAAKRSLWRLIEMDDGLVYQLPTGTYWTDEGPSSSDVRDRADRAAAAIGHDNPAIIVAKSSEFAARGLEQVSAADRLAEVILGMSIGKRRP